MGSKLVVACVMILASLAGCFDAAPASVSATDAGDENARDPIVVAFLDSGTNPYHPLFRAPEWSAPPVEGATPIQLDLDATKFEAERERWKTIEPRQLYHFTGTRLLAISMLDETPYPTLSSGHGLATSYLAAREAPNAIFVMVQIDARVCEEDHPCLMDSSIAEGMEWVSEQGWIDVVSISLGFPGNPPGDVVDPRMARFVAATHRASQDGKILVNGAGNSVVPPVTGFAAGPDWIIAVGGAELDSRGEAAIASKTVDVIANWSEIVPVDFYGETDWSRGTSLATPIVAGTLAHALSLVREADPDRVVTPQELRDALNASAYAWNATDWRPMLHDRGTPTAGLMSADLPVVAPGQQGWGYVDGSLAPEIARRILAGDHAIPEEKQEIALFQARWQAAREAYWDAAR